MNTKISYMYRDADNYKASKDIIVYGELTLAQVQQIKKLLAEDEYFIPSQVGLEDLQGELQEYDSKDWDVDHPWHELQGIESTREAPTEEITAKIIYEKFVAVKGQWEDGKAIPHIKFGGR